MIRSLVRCKIPSHQLHVNEYLYMNKITLFYVLYICCEMKQHRIQASWNIISNFLLSLFIYRKIARVFKVFFKCLRIRKAQITCFLFVTMLKQAYIWMKLLIAVYWCYFWHVLSMHVLNKRKFITYWVRIWWCILNQ